MIAVIMPIYGQEHYTDSILAQLRNQNCQVFLIDNKGDYEPEPEIPNVSIIKPGSNLRWTKGTNLGWKIALSQEYQGYLLLNNDTKLSRRFIDHLMHTADMLDDYAIIGPHYDDVHEHQKNYYQGDASHYEPEFAYKLAPFVDGTCMYVPHTVAEMEGLLDEANFGQYGWGADMDYCYRAKKAGCPIIVTGECYINHYHQGTAKLEDENWNGLAGNEMEQGMQKKWGEDWRTKIYDTQFIQYL